MDTPRAAVRPADAADIPALVALAARARAGYALAQPVFWRVAADAEARQAAFFARLLAAEATLAYVCERGGDAQGFAVGTLTPAPPVYDPGGPVCLVDDFAVATPDLWPTAGAALLAAVREAARRRCAARLVVICGHHDAPKRALLAASGCAVASEWWTGEP